MRHGRPPTAARGPQEHCRTAGDGCGLWSASGIRRPEAERGQALGNSGSSSVDEEVSPWARRTETRTHSGCPVKAGLDRIALGVLPFLVLLGTRKLVAAAGLVLVFFFAATREQHARAREDRDQDDDASPCYSAARRLALSRAHAHLPRSQGYAADTVPYSRAEVFVD